MKPALVALFPMSVIDAEGSVALFRDLEARPHGREQSPATRGEIKCVLDQPLSRRVAQRA